MTYAVYIMYSMYRYLFILSPTHLSTAIDLPFVIKEYYSCANMSTNSDSDSSSSSLVDEVVITYQTFYPGQIVIAREFPEGSLKDYRRCTCAVLSIAGSPNPEITIYKITKEFVDDGHSYPITSRSAGLYIQTITGTILAATVNFTLTHDPSFIRTCSPYTCDPGTPIKDGRRPVEGLGSITSLEDVNRIRDFIGKTEFRPLIYPLISGPQIRHPPERYSARKAPRKIVRGQELKMGLYQQTNEDQHHGYISL